MPNPGWPRWSRPTWGWLLSAALAAIAVIGYLIPHYSRLAVAWRVVLLVALVAVTVACLLGQFVMRFMRTAWRKAMAYDAVAIDLTRAACRFRRLARQSNRWPEYAVDCVEFKNGDLYLRIARDGLPDLALGDELFVLDIESQAAVVGRFAVSKDGNSEYVAGPGKDVCPVWMGCYVANGLQTAALRNNFRVFCVSTFEKGADNGL